MTNEDYNKIKDALNQAEMEICNSIDKATLVIEALVVDKKEERDEYDYQLDKENPYVK